VTLILALLLWGAQFAGPRLAGLMWALATWIKWVPAPLLLVLRPRGRAWGLAWLGAAILMSLATLPLTIVQFQALFGFGSRPLRLDYLVLLWAAVPWVWRHPGPLWWLHPRTWADVARSTRAALSGWGQRWRADPEMTVAVARRQVTHRIRLFLGLTAQPADGPPPN